MGNGLLTESENKQNYFYFYSSPPKTHLRKEGKKQAELLWSPNLVQYPPNGSDAPLSDPALSGLTERPEPFRLSVSKDFFRKVLRNAATALKQNQIQNQYWITLLIGHLLPALQFLWLTV